MTNLLLLPPAAWQPGDGMVAAGFRAPCAGGLAILAEGWPEPGAARLLSPEGLPQAFLPLADAAFLATVAEDGAAFTIEAPATPRLCRVVFVPRPAASPSLALLAPRSIRSPVRHAAYDLAAGQRRVSAALMVQDLDTALGVAAEMLLSARGAAATQAAIAAVLSHLARYPLARSPALGAFVAALTE
ncbi:hypothetical protein AAFN86_21320 [Roseomonas sp. CAU 1739]|uniref:hypothetical protein n=1 Tax=Roseomonas sp. CAU 1739 TaxID=3140364 RepID=UPI00325B25AC